MAVQVSGAVYKDQFTVEVGGSSITYVANGDGTVTVSGGVNNGDGTVTLSGSGYTSDGSVITLLP